MRRIYLSTYTEVFLNFPLRSNGKIKTNEGNKRITKYYERTGEAE